MPAAPSRADGSPSDSGGARRLAAIAFADIVGYSILMAEDEARTHRRWMALLGDVIRPGAERHHGRVVKSTGDGVLAEFPSALDAVEWAREVQELVHQAEVSQGIEARRISLRIAVHVGDVMTTDDDIYGDGVNVAARLQEYGEPGGVILSGAIYDLIRGVVGAQARDLGFLHLKNFERPVRAYALAGPRSVVTRPSWLRGSRPSLAVLPFVEYGVPSDHTYFGDGVVEDIIRALGGLKELIVISRSSTLHYGGSTIDARVVGRELGVRYVLNGSVRRGGGRIRLATELSDAETGIVILADQYEGSITDLFELQDEISRRVIATIAPQVREWELRRSMRKHPENMDAYDLTLQGMDLLYRLDYESFSRARGMFQKAIVHDASYAPAYAYAAMWHIFRIGQGWSPDPDVDAIEAAQMAARGIERDKFDALALAFHGHALSWFLKQYDAAVVFLDRALEAGPNCAMAWALSGCTCSYIGDGATGVARCQHALRLSPSDPYAFYYLAALTVAHYVNATYEEAIACGRASVARNDRFVANKRFMAASLVALGRIEEAREVARDLMRVQPRFRVAAYIPRCPIKDPAQVAVFVERLKFAGLPH